MSLEDLVGTTYGPFSARISAEQVAAYVAVTGDDQARWVEHAPPSYAGALLFVVAPSFLNDAPVRRYTKLLVHVEQTFAWHRPLEVEEKVTADGVLARVRTRGGVSFATFRSTVRSAEGVVIDASSTFLMGEGEPAQQAAEELEPPVAERGGYDALPGKFLSRRRSDHCGGTFGEAVSISCDMRLHRETSIPFTSITPQPSAPGLPACWSTAC